MARTYYQLLPYAFKRFSVLSARRTLIPTIWHYITRKPLPPSAPSERPGRAGKPALFTMNILPPMMTVWYHFVQKNLGDKVDTTIFDCSGRLDPKEFPNARVQKFLNLYAATKSEEFLRHIAKNRRIGWICDDDMFPMSGKMVDVIEQEFEDPNTASVSFRHRGWWQFEIEGKTYQPSSSYCIAFKREIIFEKENLSLSPAPDNQHPPTWGRPPGRYDTFDKANEILIRKGYRCYIVPEEEQSKYLTGYSGMSGAVMLLYLFKKPEQVLDYFLSPPTKQWSGNVLFGTLSSMLAICTIQELYTKLKGHTYPLPSLPKRHELEKILNERRQYLRKDQSMDWIEEASERLRQEL